jgi:hypothetical protein
VVGRGERARGGGRAAETKDSISRTPPPHPSPAGSSPFYIPLPFLFDSRRRYNDCYLMVLNPPLCCRLSKQAYDRLSAPKHKHLHDSEVVFRTRLEERAKLSRDCLRILVVETWRQSDVSWFHGRLEILRRK